MFSDNKIISARQTRRLFTFCYVGLGSLILPGRISEKAGTWGGLCILLGGAAGYLYLLWMRKILGNSAAGPEEELKKYNIAPVRAGIWLILALHCVWTAVYTLGVFTDVVKENLVKGEHGWLILLVILALAVYGVSGGLESWARIYEILFGFVFVPLLLMLLMGAGNIERIYVMPAEMPAWSSILEGGYEVFIYFLISFWILFFPGKSEKETRSCTKAFFSALGIFLFIYEVVLGNFGARALAKIRYPAITLMSMIRIPGNFVKRLDPLMLGVWFFSLFALLTLQLFFAAKAAGSIIISRKDPAGTSDQSEKKKYLAAISLVTAVVAAVGYGSGIAGAWYEQYMKTVGAAMMLLIPLIISRLTRCRKTGSGEGRKKKINTIAILFIFLLVSVTQSGCQSRELEERCFPMMALADLGKAPQTVRFCYTFPSPRRTEDQGDDTKEADTSFSEGKGFVRAWQDYENRLDKKTDDGHLKVVVLGEKFISDPSAYDQMLEFMQERQSFPRNAYVCVMPELDEFMKIQGGLSDDAGNYLESYIKNHVLQRKYKSVTLGMLMDEKENRMRTLRVPYIRVQNGRLSWETCYEIRRGVPVPRSAFRGKSE